MRSGMRSTEARAGWHFGFVARGGVAALMAARATSAVAAAAVGSDGVHVPLLGDDVVGDAHAVSAFEVEDLSTDAAPHLAHIPFAITINAQQFSADPRMWAFLAPPMLAAVTPLGGSSAGGTTVTISGSFLSGAGSHLLCFFRVEAAPPTALGTGAFSGGREWAARPDVSPATHHPAASEEGGGARARAGARRVRASSRATLRPCRASRYRTRRSSKAHRPRFGSLSTGSSSAHRCPSSTTAGPVWPLSARRVGRQRGRRS